MGFFDRLKKHDHESIRSLLEAKGASAEEAREIVDAVASHKAYLVLRTARDFAPEQ